MATPDGKVTFEAGGRNRVLQFTTNHLCLLEDKLAKTTLELAIEMNAGPRMATVRAMFWAGLGDGDLTLSAAGELIDEVGKGKATALVREAFEAAFPKPEKRTEGGENPPAAAAG